MTKYWLFKSEPNTYSIDDLKKDRKTHWDGVRNYQARNFMRDDMNVGDRVLFYHSNAHPSGVTGVATVCKKAYPDFTAQDERSHYYDPKATKDNPIWVMVDIAFVKKLSQLISLNELRNYPKLKNMILLKKGTRLSIQPLTKQEFDFISELKI